MAIIIITRPVRKFSYERDMKIYMDNISDGETMKINVQTGQHILKVKYDWRGSNEFPFSINDNQTRSFIISSSNLENYLLAIFGGLLLLHYFLNLKYKINFAFYLAVPAFLVLLINTIFRRNRYIMISEAGPQE